MIQEIIEDILEKNEGPDLEFKREWYWNESTPSNEMGDKWGELIKDLLSLANAYIGFVGVNRYLVFGFCESEKEIHDIDTSKIKHLKNLIEFRKNLIAKLEGYTKPSFINLDIKIVEVNSKKLLVFEIPCPKEMIELKKQLKTKTISLGEGSVIVRKGQKCDEVRVATPSEIISLKSEFAAYEKSDLFKRMNPSPVIRLPERTIDKTVQLYIDKNSSFSLAKEYPKKEKNWKEGVIYEIYRLVDDFSVIKEFIYIHDSSNQGKTFADIKSKNVIDNFTNAIILIDKPKIKDVSKRKENIKKIFKSNYIFFIEEFGYSFLYKDCIPSYEKFNLPVYVDGLYDDNDEKDISAIENLKKWFFSEDEPLLVISGHGGIGKTTLAKQFLDFVSDEIKDSGLLFIDSKEIISELSRSFSSESENKISNVFDFYEALMDSHDPEEARFNDELLKLSIDNGSLTVVLDGIDEVIAKLGDRFDVETFIKSIFNEYSSGLHQTKIIVTCRDHFWNEVGKEILLPEITLKAFNESLARDFFEQRLKGDRKKIIKAMKMAESLAVESESLIDDKENKNYIPYLLDMIGYLIDSEGDNSIKDHTEFDSRYLESDNHTDQLVAQVCKREIIKLGSLSVDDQIKLFIRIASSKKNIMSLYDIKIELQEITADFDDSLIENIKAHPLIQANNKHVNFRYDVFDNYFKTLLISDFFNKKEIDMMDKEIERIISGYLKYDSSFTREVCSRVLLDEALIVFCMDIIKTLDNTKKSSYASIVSSIVSLLLMLLLEDESQQSNIETRTKLLEDIFGSNNGSVIDGLCLVDIFGNTSSKPTFDFRNKELINCNFNNYEYFWECNMDEGTKFYSSFFKNIDPRSDVKFSVFENMFSSSCDRSLIQHLLTEKKDERDNNKETVKIELLKVFRLFYQRGNFYPKKQNEVRKKLSTVRLLQRLLEMSVIIDFKDPKKPTMQQYRIHEDYKSVVAYIEQGSPSTDLQKLIARLI